MSNCKLNDKSVDKASESILNLYLQFTEEGINYKNISKELSLKIIRSILIDAIKIDCDREQKTDSLEKPRRIIGPTEFKTIDPTELIADE